MFYLPVVILFVGIFFDLILGGKGISRIIHGHESTPNSFSEKLLGEIDDLREELEHAASDKESLTIHNKIEDRKMILRQFIGRD